MLPAAAESTFSLVKTFNDDIRIHLLRKFLDSVRIIGMDHVGPHLHIPADVEQNIRGLFFVIEAQRVDVLPAPRVLVDQGQHPQPGGDALLIDDLFLLQEAGQKHQKCDGDIEQLMLQDLHDDQHADDCDIHDLGVPVSRLDDSSEFHFT